MNNTKKNKQSGNALKIISFIVVLMVLVVFLMWGAFFYFKQIEGTVSKEFDRITISVGKDMERERGISWFTKEDDSWGNDLQVIESEKKSFWLAKTITAVTGVTEKGEAFHQAYVDALKPDTTYRFRVGDKKSGQYSRVGTFTTAKSEEEYKFLAISDTQIEEQKTYEFAAETMRQGLVHEEIDLIINAGDLVDKGSKWKQWKSLINSGEDVFRNNTMAVIGGNHITEADMVLKHFMLPNETKDIKSDGINYSFNYGLAHIIVMDTNESGEISQTVSDAQINWLREDVAKAKEQGIKYFILTLHKGPYTVGPHAFQEEIAGEYGSRKNLVPILEELGIDLVLQGHDHIPSCTYPLKEGEISEDGIVYITMGAAGDKTYTLKDDIPSEYLSLFAYFDSKQRERETYHNYAVLSVMTDGIIVEMYENASGKEELLYQTKIVINQ